MPCVVLPLLSRVNLEQVVGTTNKLFQSRLIISAFLGTCMSPPETENFVTAEVKSGFRI